MDDAPLIPGWFTYLAWSVGSPRVGPFVLTSRRRTDAAATLTRIASAVEKLPGVARVRVLGSTFIPPLPGVPQYDLAALAHGEHPLDTELATRAREAGLPEPVLATTARNVVRFGDTDASDGNILLNHFVGKASAPVAVEAWTAATTWYSDVLGVDNSTLLQFEQPAPFLVMNYARIPGAPGPFVLQQILRPSFHQQVGKVLDRAGVRPLPVFLKAVTA